MLVDKESALMSDLLFTVHHHGGDDVAIANITAVSLNFWLIKPVKEQSLIYCNSKFTGCVILKEH